MKKFLLGVLAISLLTSPLAAFANPDSSPESKLPSENASSGFAVVVIRVAPSVFSVNVHNPRERTQKVDYLRPNQDALAIPGTKTQFNVKPYLIANSVTFPPGSWAIYDAPTSTVVVWNTQLNDDICRQLLDFGGPGPAMLINVAISVVEYTPKVNAKFSPTPLAVSEFAKQLKSPMRLLSYASGVARSGQPFAVSNIPNAIFTDNCQIKPFAKGITGLAVTLEPALSLNMEIALDRIRCRFRNNPKETDGQSVDVNFTTSAAVRYRYPLVIYTQMIPAAGKDKTPHGIAVIVSAEIVNSGGWKIDATGKPIP